MSQAPTLDEVLDAAIRGVLDDVRVALPGQIESYDAATRRASVQVLIMDGSDGEDGARRSRPIAVLTDVPVAGVGSGQIRIKLPVRAGDPCWLLFASSSIARLKAGARGVTDPGDDRHHHVADAIAIPWVVFDGEDAEADAMIEFTDDEKIRCGGDQPLVTRAEFLSHTHATAGTGTPSPPVLGAAPGSEVTFPGTGKLRG